jgi:hypothetical protein
MLALSLGVFEEVSPVVNKPIHRGLVPAQTRRYPRKLRIALAAYPAYLRSFAALNGPVA